MSQPKPRSAIPVAGCSGATIFSSTMRDRGNLLGRPARRSSKFCAYTARSSPVLNSPACPATLPMRRDVGSCTKPRNITSPGNVFDPGTPDEIGSCSYSVGAMRGIQDSGGRNRVCARPSGSMMKRRVYSSSVTPESFSTTAPSTIKLMSL